MRSDLFNNRRLVTSDSSNPGVLMSFAVYVESSPSSSDKDTKSSPCTAILTSSSELWNSAARCLPLSEASQLSTDQGRVVKLPDVRRILSSMHALDESANFVFTIFLTILCSKSDVWECLGCSLEMYSADVVVSKLQWFSFARPTHRHHDCDRRLHSLKWWHCREH